MNASTHPDDRDRGATLALVVILLTVLLACGAIVVDLGFLYVERRQLQNGADAAALAVAQDCAKGNCLDEWGTARTAASANASTDGFSAVDVVCGGGPTAVRVGLALCVGPVPPDVTNALGWVKVTTSTLDASGGTQIDFLLDAFVGALSGKTVHATAISAWGVAGTGRVLPFAIHECEYSALGGVLDPLNGVYPTGEQIIYSRYTNGQADSQDCRTDYLGDGVPPGNYGWLDKPNLDCFATAVVDERSGGDTGNNSEIRRCSAEILNQTVLLAIWREVNALPGANAEYEIIAFVGFTVTGYYLSGDGSPGFTCPPNPTDPTANLAQLRCFRGTFTGAVFDGDFGGTYNTGVTSVKMIG